MIKKKILASLVVCLVVSSSSAYGKDLTTMSSLENLDQTTIAVRTNDLSVDHEGVKENSSMSLEDKLNTLEEIQKNLSSEIETLKGKLEYQQSSLDATNVSVGTLQDSLQKNQSKVDRLSDSDKKGMKWGGYAHAGFGIYNNAPRTPAFIGANGENGSTFSHRRVVFSPKYIFNDKFYWDGEIEFEDLGNDFVGIERSEFIYNVNDYLNIRAGLIVPTLNQTNLHHEAHVRNLIDFPLVDVFVTPAIYRDLGIGAFGMIPLGDSDAMVKYEVNVLNGFTDTWVADGQNPLTPISSRAGFSGLRNGRPHRTEDNDHFRDNNANKAVHARVAFVPCKNIEIGGMIHSGSIGDKGNYLNILGVDAKVDYKRLSLLFEYANALLKRDTSISSEGISFRRYPANMNGFHVEPTLAITDKLALVGSFGEVDLDEGNSGNTIKRGTVGFKYQVMPNVFLKGEYLLTLGRSRFSPENRLSNGILTELAVGF